MFLKLVEISLLELGNIDILVTNLKHIHNNAHTQRTLVTNKIKY